MSQNVVKAEQTHKEKGAVGGSWHVQDTEVIFKTRENRSSRPEVVYHLSPPSSTGRQYESTPELRPPVGATENAAGQENDGQENDGQKCTVRM